MKGWPAGEVAIVTGGGSGIGEGARSVAHVGHGGAESISDAVRAEADSA